MCIEALQSELEGFRSRWEDVSLSICKLIVENSKLNTALLYKKWGVLRPRNRRLHYHSSGLDFGVIELQDDLAVTKYKGYISVAIKEASLFLNRVNPGLVQVHFPERNEEDSNLLSDDMIIISIKVKTGKIHSTDNETTEPTISALQAEIKYLRELLHDAKSQLADLLQENQEIKTNMTRIRKAKAVSNADAAYQQLPNVNETKDRSELVKKLMDLFGLE